MKTIHQCPYPEIKIYKYSDLVNPKIIFTSQKKEERDYTNLLSYTWNESVDDIAGSFQFTVSGEKTKDYQATLYDKIEYYDVVKIYEGDYDPVFTGVITAKNITASMGGNGVARNVVFSGKSVGGLLCEFIIDFDKKLMNASDTEAINKKFTDELIGKNYTIKSFIEKTLEQYVGIAIGEDKKKISTTRLYEIIKKIFPNGIIHSDNDENILYPIGIVFYQAGKNEITGVWRSLFPSPYYEMYTQTDDNGTVYLNVRVSPFDTTAWSNLNIYNVKPENLISYTLGQSNEEIYTYFAAYLEGSVLSHEQYYTIQQCKNGTDSSIIQDKEKLEIYGFRPLVVSFRGYSLRDKKEGEDLPEKLKDMNIKMAKWFGKLDEMMTGSIVVCTDFSDRMNNPRIGNRCSFLGGEFYVRSAEHSWTYGGTPTINMSIGRGGYYDSGEFAGPIEKLGKTLIELEQE